MRHLTRHHATVTAVAATVVAALATGTPADAAGAVDPVCAAHCRFHSLAAAIKAARPGDTVALAAGRYHGGVTIDKDLRITGAGPERTRIAGGGPVLTIGHATSAPEPTVSLSGVTITGGDNRGSAEIGLGGGISIPAAGSAGHDGPYAPSPGATVTIGHSVIAANRVVPRTTKPLGPPCPTGPCPFALAAGGGIYNTGALSLIDTAIEGNSVAGVASDADGAGVFSAGRAKVRLLHSRVRRNVARAVAPNGRYAEGAGLFINDGGALELRSSQVTGNRAELTSVLPVTAAGKVIDMNANGAGVHTGNRVSTVVAGSVIAGNVASASDPAGEPLAFDAALLQGSGPLRMTRSKILDNVVRDTSLTSADVGPSGTAVELDGGGTITSSLMASNRVMSTTATGTSGSVGAVAVYTFAGTPRRVSITATTIEGNVARATSHTGPAIARAGAIFNNSLLTLRHDTIAHNRAVASGTTEIAQGGGIWNGPDLSGPPVDLRLIGTRVVGNALRGDPGAQLQGGGVFSTAPLTARRSTIRANTPDQCSGTGC
jgi:hypothetical protein